MKVSIIMSVYNGDQYLEECLQSVSRQTYKSLELVIVNDGSTDRSDDIIKKFRTSNAWLNVVYLNQDNSGLTVSLNSAIRAVSGELVARLDADDYFPPDRIQKSVDFLLSSGSHFITTAATRVSFDITKVPNVFLINKNKLFEKEFLLMGNCHVHGTFFGYSWVFRDYPYDEDYRTAQDYEFLLRIAEIETIKKGFLNQPLYFLRVHNTSSGRSGNGNQVDNARRICSAYGGDPKRLIPATQGLKRRWLTVLRRIRFFGV